MTLLQKKQKYVQYKKILLCMRSARVSRKQGSLCYKSGY